MARDIIGDDQSAQKMSGDFSAGYRSQPVAGDTGAGQQAQPMARDIIGDDQSTQPMTRDNGSGQSAQPMAVDTDAVQQARPMSGDDHDSAEASDMEVTRADLDMVEKIMLEKIEQADPDLRNKLLNMAQSQPVST